MIKAREYRIVEFNDGRFECQAKSPIKDWHQLSVQYSLQAAKEWFEKHKNPEQDNIKKIYES